jgi:ribosomal protein S2
LLLLFLLRLSVFIFSGSRPNNAIRILDLSKGWCMLELSSKVLEKGKRQMSDLTIKQNQDTAFAIVRKLVGGDLTAYYESSHTIAMVWAECGRNAEIQRLTTNYVWGSFEKAESNLNKLEAKLREVFELPELVF